MAKINERKEERLKYQVESKDKITELYKNRKNTIHAKLERKFKKTEFRELEEKKRKLEEIRSLKAPMKKEDLDEHISKYAEF